MSRRSLPKSPDENENVLFVEGKDDRHIVWGLLEFRRFPDKAFAVSVAGNEDSATGGYEYLRATLRITLQRGDYKRLGVVVDADEDIAARWMSLRSLLVEMGYSRTPSEPDSEGTIVLPDNPESLETADAPFRTRVGIWVMPDNKLPGAIEEFARYLVPPTKADMWDHAEACVANLPQKPEPLTDNWKAKARIHSYLAWQESPGVPMGAAINRRYLDGDALMADPFMNWLSRLYELT